MVFNSHILRGYAPGITGGITMLALAAVVVVLVNPSVALEPPIILNSSHDPSIAISQNFSNTASPVSMKYSKKYERKPGELLVKYTNKLSTNDFKDYYKSQNITLIKSYPEIGYHLIRVDESKIETTIKALFISDKFESAEPNYIVKALKRPDAPEFDQLWGLDNTGQTGGTPDADIDAPEAWNISTGSRGVIVAVIDTGVDYTHEDLAGNMWTNPGEIPGNGIDDDHNGFVDDYYGWDFAYDDNNPMDGNYHGTHVSGIIGGVGNNGKGVAGVSWNVSIMAVKFLNDEGDGYVSDAIDAINYATLMGADIMSNSWGGADYSSALEAAIKAADNAGILFVASAGNYAANTDDSPVYPAGFDVANIISVAATDHNDSIADFSNYGNMTVDIGAPGVGILSPVPGNGYDSYSGTSMAAPYVSGAAALLKAFNPTLTHYQIKNILMNSVDTLPSLNGKTVSGGRLNIHKAITIAPPQVNLIKNPGFESGTLSWSFFPTGTGKFSVVSPGYEGTKAARLAPGENGTNIQLYQTNVVLEPKGIYRLSFAASSTTGHDLVMRLYQHVPPYTDYGLNQNFDIGTGWERFTTEFTAPDLTNTVYDGRLIFWLAPFVESGDIYYIDDVRLEKIGVDNTPPMVIRNTPSEENGLANTKINVTFSEAMNRVSAQSAISISPVTTGSFSWNGNTMIFTPDPILINSTIYTVTVGTGAKDIAGNNLQSSFSWQFSTGLTHNINKGINYSSIQAAIDAASPGDEILVDRGIYWENIIITRQLILRGESNLTTIIRGNGKGNVVEVEGKGVIIEGFRIQNGSNGIYVNSSDNVISNNVITNMHGINGTDNKDDSGVGGNGGLSSGIYISRYINNTISGNTLSNITGGIGGAGGSYGSGGAGGPSSGIYLSGSTKNILTGNTISNIVGGTGGTGTDSGDGGSGGLSSGVYLSNSTNNALAGNIISSISGGEGGEGGWYLIDYRAYGGGNGGSGGISSGIYVSDSPDNSLTGNMVSYISGGAGGTGGYGSSGGSGGFSSGTSLMGSQNNIVKGNSINNIKGGGGGNGGIDVEHGGGPGSNGGISSGIYLSGSSNNNLKSNIIGNLTGGMGGNGGIYCGSGGNGGITAGIYISYSTNNIIIGNTVNYTTGGTGGAAGYDEYINCGSGGSGVSSSGIYLTGSTSNTLSRNILSDSNYGLSLDLSSNNTIYDNIFINNNDVQSYGSNVNIWNITGRPGTNIIGGNNLGGNFWANPSGKGFGRTCNDIDKDGICDLPYVLDANNTDYLPLAYKSLPRNITSCTIISSSGEFTLNNSILSSGASNCISITASNVVLDGAGHTIDGIDAEGTSGIYVYNSSKIITNVTVKNIRVTDWSNGIYYINSKDGIIINNSANSNSNGILLKSSSINNVTGNNISNSTNIGINVYENSNNNTISSNKVNNSRSGIFFLYAFNTTASNNIMENNSFNFGVGGDLQSYFDGNNIDTSNLANGRPIYYIKYGKNTIYDGSTKAGTFFCILCNNVTVRDLEMHNMDKGVYFLSTINSRIQNITVKESGWGVFLRNSANNIIQDSEFSNNNIYDYSEKGVSIYSSDSNILTNNTFISNNYGIEFSSSNKNTIYNNYFNNINNLLFRGTNNNIWNITKKSGKNIIGGSYIGGNFWGNPGGTGFSQVCPDSNNDGLCNLKYSPGSNNNDYLPLKFKAVTGITVNSPKGGENWTRGTAQTISWNNAGNPGSYVKIELLKSGTLSRTIVASTLNDGSHSWIIPATQPAGNDYKIRITSKSNPAYANSSKSNFNISS
ncbi:MAG: hypothetical protein FIB07_00855 [Candidatus Methanoperedens sp.]|nr:hypothetical protein [Candidatus Methanoperedens sp.]